jgi:hypothetical protein
MSEATPPEPPETETWASVRADLRELTVANALRYLGADRKRDAEKLADAMMAHLDNIVVSGAGVFTLTPRTTMALTDEAREELIEQMRWHSYQVLQTAIGAMALLLHQVLKVAVQRDR